MSHRWFARLKKCWSKETKMSDTIIQEIRQTRDDYARQFNYDLHQMCLDLRREQELSGAKVVTFSTKATESKVAQYVGQADTNKAGVSPSRV